jgi:uncharacterized protein involved in response to NO
VADDQAPPSTYRRSTVPAKEETIMNTQHPSKRGSALMALPPAIVVELAAIAVNIGGAVSGTAAFLALFAACHQVRLARWRRHEPA